MSSPVRALSALIVLTLLVLALLASYGAKAASFPGGPPGTDGELTVPGAINPAITQANIKTTICVSGWTKTVRPPASVTNKLKFSLMAKAGIPLSQKARYELDHKVSLEVGGAPSDPNNLSLEPYFGPRNAHEKDKVEDALHRAVCSGSITLIEAQHELETDWVASYERLFNAEP